MTTGNLVWKDRDGLGFCPVVPVDRCLYGESYWTEYVARAATPMGLALTDARWKLVAKYLDSSECVVDVGVGSGQFISARGGVTFGYDVNPVAIRWLLDRGVWWDPYFQNPPNATFFDSLEHMERPEDLVRRVPGFIFVSIPIFRDRDHVLRSKHWKPGEHIWYFTNWGLRRWMSSLGFDLFEENEMETTLGREGITTFVFAKRK